MASETITITMNVDVSKLEEALSRADSNVGKVRDKVDSLGSKILKAGETLVKSTSDAGKALSALAKGEEFNWLDQITGTVPGFAELKDTAKETWEVVGKELNLDSVKAFGDGLKAMSGALSPIGSFAESAFSTMESGIDKYSGAIKKGMDYASSGTNVIASTTSTIVGNTALGLNTVVGKTLGALKTLFGMTMKMIVPGAIVGALLLGLGAAGGAYGEKINSFIQMATKKGPEIISGLTEGIATTVPLLIAQGATILNSLLEALIANLPFLLTLGTQIVTSLIEGLGASLPLFLASGIELVTGLITGLIDNLPLIFMAGLQLMQELLNGIILNLPLLIESLGNIITSISTFFTENLPLILQTGINILLALIGGIVTAIPQLIPIVITALNALIEGITTNLPIIIQGGIQLLQALITGIIESLPALTQAIPQVITAILLGIIQNLPTIIEGGIKLMGALVGGLIQALPDLMLAVPRIITAIWDTIQNTDWLSLGKDIILGLAEGIASSVKAVGDAITEVAGKAIGWFKEKFGINSPSTVLRDEIGVYLVPGIVAGVEETSDLLQKAIDNVQHGIGLKVGATAPLETGAISAMSPGAVAPWDAISNQSKDNSTATPFQPTDMANYQGQGTVLSGLSLETTQVGIAAASDNILSTVTGNGIALQTFLRGLYQTSTQEGIASCTLLTAGIQLEAKNIQAIVMLAGNALLVFLRESYLVLISEGVNAFTQLNYGVQGQLSILFSNVVQTMNSIVAHIQGVKASMYQHGSDMISHMVSGINAQREAVESSVGGLVDLVIEKFRSGFKIASPSKEMYKIGSFLMEGLINAMNDSEILKFTEGMIEELKTLFDQSDFSITAAFEVMGDTASDLFSRMGINYGSGSTGSGAYLGQGGLLWPTDSHQITSYFGGRESPGGIGSTDHRGIDIGAPTGAPIYAAGDGEIISAGWQGGYGNAVGIYHGNGLATFYAHMSQILAAVGQIVKMGQVIGLIGSTGNSTGPHLHFETSVNGVDVDPGKYFGFSVGSRYVPADMLAYIHKGEAIIPKNENPYKNSRGAILPNLADMVSSMGRRSRGKDDGVSQPIAINQEININQPIASVYEMAKTFERTQKDLAYGY